jgi:aldose 1-epimerase
MSRTRLFAATVIPLLAVVAAAWTARLEAVRPVSQAPVAPSERREGVTERAFGTLPGGENVSLYTLSNARGMRVAVTNYGGTVVSIHAPDRDGRTADVVLGYVALDGYLKASPYFGSIVGRYANRIAKGRFTLDGRTYTLATNNGENALHGGKKGFDKVVWQARPSTTPAGPAVTLSYTSPDGEEGYPGTLKAEVTYTLTDDNELRIDYAATTDKPTVVNLSNHSYFNLGGPDERDILSHLLTIDADRYTPVDPTLIPTGQLAPVEGTPFDFRKPTPIGSRIEADDEQLRRGRGYDHNFVLNGEAGKLRPVVRLAHGPSGRVMEILTTEPGVQFYSGNFLDGSITGKGGKVYVRRAGLCLETQHYPDSPNHQAFPSTVLRPGERYRSTTIYRFTTEKAPA